MFPAELSNICSAFRLATLLRFAAHTCILYYLLAH